MAETLVYAGDLRARIETSAAGNIWTYSLINDEPLGSPNYLNTLNIEPRATFTVSGTPTGWLRYGTGGSSVLWYASAPEFDIAPAATLAGFVISGQAALANPTPCTITSGNHSTGSPGAVLLGGVWTPPPNAVPVSLGGRVVHRDGRGIFGASVTLRRASQTIERITNSSGYYRFENLPLGGPYFLEVKTKTFLFSPKSIFLTSSRQDFNFAM